MKLLIILLMLLASCAKKPQPVTPQEPAPGFGEETFGEPTKKGK